MRIISTYDMRTTYAHLPKIPRQEVIVRKIFHRSSYYIGLFFKYDKEIISILNALPGRRYSKTHSCFYFPYRADMWALLRESQLNLKIDRSYNTGTRQSAQQSDTTSIATDNSFDANLPDCEKDRRNHKAGIRKSNFPVKIVLQGSYFRIYFNYHPEEINFIKSLYSSYWNKSEKVWMVKASVRNLDQLQMHYGYYSETKYLEIKSLIQVSRYKSRAILENHPEGKSRFSVHFKGAKAPPAWIKTLSGRSFDATGRKWILPYGSISCTELIKRLSHEGWEVYDYLPKTHEGIDFTRDWSKRKIYLMRKIRHRYAEEVDQYVTALISERYSWNTIKQYTGSINRWLSSMQAGVDLSKLDSSAINKYLGVIAVSNVSYQEINRHISAIKLFLSRVLKSSVEIQDIRRPRRPKSLPKVMSPGEITRLLDTVKNIKHLAMLYLAYGSGLRSGEIVKLKMTDVQMERNQIWIRGGKGNKDRLVVLSSASKTIFSQYMDQYKPNYYVFAGQKPGMPYSSKSLSTIFKRALRKAGLSEGYKLHSLRHSFATHLYEQDRDILKVQAQLGHSNLETTLIYTHIGKDETAQVVSPLDRLLESKSRQK